MGRAQDLFERIEREGIGAIRSLILDRQSEELFLDFKRSSDQGRGNSLSQTDRNNLAKSISGFGNSAGGIIIWGVDCSRNSDGADVASFEVPLDDAKRFRSWLEGAISGCTLPPHGRVQHCVVETGQNREGFVVTYIPQSNDAPHQVVGRLQYYMRAGSDFVPVPHQILSGMFGRRPQPDIVGQWLSGPVKVIGDSIQCQVGYLLRNEGAGIARDMFLDVKVWNSGGPRCQIAFEVTDNANWSGCFALGRFWNLVARSDYRMPPGAFAQPLAMTVTFAPPFEEQIKIERIQGCEGAPLSRFTIENSANAVEGVYREFMNSHGADTLSDSDWENVAGRLLGLDLPD